jgi:hypothetical protein
MDRVFACADFAASVAARSRGLISSPRAGQISWFPLEILPAPVRAARVRFIFPVRSSIRPQNLGAGARDFVPAGLSVCASWRAAPGLVFVARLSAAGFDFLLALSVSVTVAGFCSLPSILAPSSMFPLEISLPAPDPSLGFIFPLERAVSSSLTACCFGKLRAQGLAFGFPVARSKLWISLPSFCVTFCELLCSSFVSHYSYSWF